MKESIIIKIDIKGFNKRAQSQSPKETADYISAYYKKVEEIIFPYPWRFVKGMGDGILIVADSNLECIPTFYDELSQYYAISLKYRRCSYAELKIEIGDYSCVDIIGQDINNLFLDDDATQSLG